MPSEQIGTCGHAQWPDGEAIQFELEFGIACLRCHCGPEPAGASLEVVWHEHDIGAYATISLVWEGPGVLFEEDWEYLERCSTTLAQLDECVDWETLHTIRQPRATENKSNGARLPTYRIVAAVSAVCAVSVLALATAVIPEPYRWPSHVITTSKALGLTIPPSLLLRADQIIQ